MEGELMDLDATLIEVLKELKYMNDLRNYEMRLVHKLPEDSSLGQLTKKYRSVLK